MTQNVDSLRTVLIARFSAIGDVAMTIPVVYSVCRTYPRTRFVMITRAGLEQIFLNKPENLIVKGLQLDDSRYKGVFGMRRLTDELAHEYNFDTFIDLHDVLRTKLIRFFCRLRGIGHPGHKIKVAHIDKGRRQKRAITRTRNKKLRQLEAQTDRYADTFARAGFSADTSIFGGLFGGRCKADTQTIQNIVPAGTKNGHWIVIAPFAAHQGKIYPVELMKKVVDQLAADTDTRIFLLGGGSPEKEILESWADEHQNVHCLAGKKLGFSVELALLNHADVAVTMDSANMHLAALAQTPVISIWGATHPYTGFAGWNQDSDHQIQLPMPCRPCSTYGNKPCARADYHCLSAIPVGQIISKVRSILNTADKK